MNGEKFSNLDVRGADHSNEDGALMVDALVIDLGVRVRLDGNDSGVTLGYGVGTLRCGVE